MNRFSRPVLRHIANLWRLVWHPAKPHEWPQIRLAAAPPGRELIAVPELGPLWLGYNLHAFPARWEDAKVLRKQIERSWRRVSKK